MSARHMSSMPYTGPVAGTIKDGRTTIRTVCMICGHVIVHGPEIDGRSSHGLCDHPDCTRLTTEPVTVKMLDRLTSRSERLWGRYYHTGRSKDGWERARRRVMAAIRFACESGRGAEGDPHQPGLTPEGSRKVAEDNADV